MRSLRLASSAIIASVLILAIGVAVTACGDSGPKHVPGSVLPAPWAKPVADVPALVERIITSLAFQCVNRRFLKPLTIDASPDVIGAIGEAQARLSTADGKNPLDIAFSAPLKARALPSVRRIAKVTRDQTLIDLVDNGPKAAPDNILSLEYALYANNHARAADIYKATRFENNDSRHVGILVALDRWDDAMMLVKKLAPDPKTELAYSQSVLEMSRYAKDPNTVARAVKHFLAVVDKFGANGAQIEMAVRMRELRRAGYGPEARPIRERLWKSGPTSLQLIALAIEATALGERVSAELQTAVDAVPATPSKTEYIWQRDYYLKPLAELIATVETFPHHGDQLWELVVRHIAEGLDPAIDLSLTALCDRTKEF